MIISVDVWRSNGAALTDFIYQGRRYYHNIGGVLMINYMETINWKISSNWRVLIIIRTGLKSFINRSRDLYN